MLRACANFGKKWGVLESRQRLGVPASAFSHCEQLRYSNRGDFLRHNEDRLTGIYIMIESVFLIGIFNGITVIWNMVLRSPDRIPYDVFYCNTSYTLCSKRAWIHCCRRSLSRPSF